VIQVFDRWPRLLSGGFLHVLRPSVGDSRAAFDISNSNRLGQ
jgi:hypothetical protein